MKTTLYVKLLEWKLYRWKYYRCISSAWTYAIIIKTPIFDTAKQKNIRTMVFEHSRFLLSNKTSSAASITKGHNGNSDINETHLWETMSGSVITDDLLPFTSHPLTHALRHLPTYTATGEAKEYVKGCIGVKESTEHWLKKKRKITVERRIRRKRRRRRKNRKRTSRRCMKRSRKSRRRKRRREQIFKILCR